jgi:hypothetical protein
MHYYLANALFESTKVLQHNVLILTCSVLLFNVVFCF